MVRLSMRGVARGALRVFGYMVAFGFFGFMLTPALMTAATALRVAVIGLLILGAFLLMFMDGAASGERDCAMSDTLDRLAAKEGYTPSAAESAKRYHRLKGVLSAALGALPGFLLAVVVAVNAAPFAYTVQDAPGWMASYAMRPEVGEAVAYMGVEAVPPSVADYMRVAVRFLLFPYVGLAGAMSDAASVLFDRLSPLLMLILPALSAIGYQFGPGRRKRSVAAIEKAKNTPRKRLKKERRQEGAKEKRQLV